jgi:FkbM family methyltransferase
LFPRLGFHPVLDYFGVKIRLGKSKLSQSLYAEGTEQRVEDARVIAESLLPGDVFVDVGANIGALSCLGARKVGEKGICVAIEAHPRAFCELLQNIQMNRLHVVALMSAIGDKKGFVRFSDGSADDQNKVDAAGHCGGALSVYMTTLDSLLPEIIGGRRVKLLKIDVEGYEYFVLKGAAKILDRVDKVYFEISQRMLMENGVAPRQLLDLLISRGFSISCPDGAPLDIDSATFLETRNLVGARIK